jgi:hypothetical protein
MTSKAGLTHPSACGSNMVMRATRTYVQLGGNDELRLLAIQRHISEFTTTADAIRWSIRRAFAQLPDEARAGVPQEGS